MDSLYEEVRKALIESYDLSLTFTETSWMMEKILRSYIDQAWIDGLYAGWMMRMKNEAYLNGYCLEEEAL